MDFTASLAKTVSRTGVYLNGNVSRNIWGNRVDFQYSKVHSVQSKSEERGGILVKFYIIQNFCVSENYVY